MSGILRIFIGYDSKEPIAFHVLAHSILTRTSWPVEIVPLTRQSVARIYNRERAANEATEFSLTRFLVPYLSDYRGLSLFMDCDMLCRVDIADVMWSVLAEQGKAVHCCQHDYEPKATTKFLGQPQTRYPRKNWSSFMVFNNARCRALTPAYVSAASGLDLHRFNWLDLPYRDGKADVTPGQEAIGALPVEWNWLVGEYRPNPDAFIYHYTNGGPYFDAYKDCDHADEWWAEYHRMRTPMTVPVAEVVS